MLVVGGYILLCATSKQSLDRERGDLADRADLPGSTAPDNGRVMTHLGPSFDRCPTRRTF